MTDSCIELNLTDSNVLDLEFRNTPLGCLSGYKLNEQDIGLSGWTIEVRNASGPVNSIVTDSTGFWQAVTSIPEPMTSARSCRAVTRTSLQPQ